VAKERDEEKEKAMVREKDEEERQDTRIYFDDRQEEVGSLR
jgi:hypothetical protein